MFEIVLHGRQQRRRPTEDQQPDQCQSGEHHGRRQAREHPVSPEFWRASRCAVIDTRHHVVNHRLDGPVGAKAVETVVQIVGKCHSLMSSPQKREAPRVCFATDFPIKDQNDDRKPTQRLYQAQIPLAEAWGGREVASPTASASSLRFVHRAGPNPQYFNTGRGVTADNFASDQFTGFHAKVVPGTNEYYFLIDPPW